MRSAIIECIYGQLANADDAALHFWNMMVSYTFPIVMTISG